MVKERKTVGAKALSARSLVALAALAVVTVLALPWALVQGEPQGKTAAVSASLLDALPADTSVVLRARNATELQKKWKASPFYALKDQPDVKKLIDDLSKQMETGLADAKGKLGFDPMSLFDHIEGEVVIALGGLEAVIAKAAAAVMTGQQPFSPNDVPLLIAVDAGSKAGDLRAKIGKILDLAQKEEGFRKEVEDFQGGKITTLTGPKDSGETKSTKKSSKKKKKKGITEDDDDGDAAPPPAQKQDDPERVFLGDRGSLVLFALNRKHLEQVMAGMAAPAESALSKNADFTATLREVNPAADIHYFVNIRPAAIAARKALASNPIGGVIWQLVESKILGKSLKNLAGGVLLRENDVQGLGFINNGGGSDGIFGVFKGVDVPGRPAAIVPEDADQYASFAVNMQALYAIIRDVANQAFAMSQGMMGGGQGGQENAPDIEQFVEAQFQIKPKDVIAAFGNAVHFYQKGAATEAEPFPNFSLSLELKDANPVKDLIQKVGAMAGGIQAKTYLDHEIFPLAEGLGEGGGPTLGFADKLFVFGMKEESVKEVIRRSGKGGKGLSDNPAFQALSKIIPSRVIAVSYSSPKSFGDSIDAMRNALNSAGMPFRIPDLKALGEVFGGSVGYAVWKDQGLYSESLMVYRKAKPATKG